MQWLYDVDDDGNILDKRSLLSRPVYTGNNCKRWDGDDQCESSATLNIGAQDFELGLEMRLDNISQSKYRPYFGRWLPDGVGYAGNVSIHQGAGTIVYGIAKSHEGAQTEFGHTNTATLGTTLFHTFLLKRVGTTITFYVDGVARGSATYPATDTFMVNRKLNYRGGPCTRSRAWVDIAGVRVVDYTYAAGPALVEWDRSGNGNHGVYTTTSGINTMATTSDEAPPWNILNGFSVAAMGDGTSYYQTTIRPTLSDKLEIQFNGNSTSTNDAIIGVYAATDDTKRFLLYSDGNRYLRCVVNGTTTVLSQTAILDNMWHTVIIDCVAQTAKLDDAAPVAIDITGLALTSDLRVFGSIGVGGSVALCSYIKYWQSGILTQHLRPNRKGELVNVLNGIKATTVGTGITIQYIPPIIDRSADVLGNEVMYPGGMYIHNGAESTITQTDNFFIDGTINFYSADGATQDDKTYADFLAHEPFKDNLLLQWKSVGGVCLGCEAMQLPLAYTWTKARYNAALAFMHKFTSDCGAKIFTVTEPTGGWLRTYDPNTATAGDAYDFLATLVHDMHTGFQTYAVTEPTGGWVRTFDPLDADLTLGTVQDVLATVAHDIGSTVQAYALNTGGTELYTYNPNTATFNNAANVLYSLMLKLKHFGFIL